MISRNYKKEIILCILSGLDIRIVKYCNKAIEHIYTHNIRNKSAVEHVDGNLNKVVKWFVEHPQHNTQLSYWLE